MEIVDRIKMLVDFTQDIVGYFSKPRETLDLMLLKSKKANYPVDSNKLTSLVTGMTSEMTKEYAISSGKRALINAFQAQITEIVDDMIKRYKNVKIYNKELVDAMVSLDAVYNDGLIDNRWFAIKGSMLYQKYFVERLTRDFLQEVNSVVYGSEIVLTVEKIILIMRRFLNKISQDSLIESLVETNRNTKALLSLTNHMESLVCLLPENVDLSKLPKALPPFKVTVNIYNKSQVGKILRELALDTPDIDRTNEVDILTGMESLTPMFNSSYKKLGVNVKDVQDVLIDGYQKDTVDVLIKVKDAMIKIVTEYLNIQTTEEEFKDRITNYLNVLIRVADIDNAVTTKTNEVCKELANTISIYIAIFNLYYNMMMHSLTLDPSQKV